MSKPKSIITEYTLDDDLEVEIIEDYVVEPDTVLQDMNLQYVPSTDTVVEDLDVSSMQYCPRCAKPLRVAINIVGAESVSWKECPECGTLVNTFIPTAYQAAFLRRPERYRLTGGGYGSGKTTTDVEDVIKHLILIPGSRVVVAARTYPALDATFVKEFNSRFPLRLLKRKNDQKHEYTFTNGSELLYRSFDDPTKLKSLNASKIIIVEGSDVPEDGFIMMQSRLRNTAALIPWLDDEGKPIMVWDDARKAMRIKYRYDARSINIETNPASNWVKKFLLDSKVCEFYGDAYNEGYRFRSKPDPNKYTQVVSTNANPHLPEGYEEEQTRGKSEAYVAQYFKGSFNFGTNLVFPNFGTTIVNPKPLPRAFDERGRRVLYYVIGWDYGIQDHTHVMFGAISLETRKLYWYDEMRINNTDVKTLAKKYRHQYRLNNTDMQGLLMLPRFDGRSLNKREADLRTIGDLFADEGLHFEPSFASHEARIIKMNSLINHNQMETYSTCEFFIDEMLNYTWKLDRSGQPTKTPKDGNDHGITAAEFVVVELPTNLQEINLSAYVPQGTRIYHDRKVEPVKKEAVFNPLERNPNERNTDGYLNNFVVSSRPPVVASVRSIYDSDDEELEEHYPTQLGAWVP